MKLKDEGKADDRRLQFHPSAFILFILSPPPHAACCIGTPPPAT